MQLEGKKIISNKTVVAMGLNTEDTYLIKWLLV